MSVACPVVVAGVGGQGVISLIHVLGAAAVSAGLDTRIGQIYGLSQRGGSVEATIRFGLGSTSFVAPGEAEVVVGLEPVEAERAIPLMAPSATVLINRTPLVPSGLTQSGASYPPLESIVSRIEEVAADVRLLDGTSLAERTGNVRMLNTVMIGVMAGSDLLPFAAEHLEGAVLKSTPPIRANASAEAYRLGFEIGDNTCH